MQRGKKSEAMETKTNREQVILDSTALKRAFGVAMTLTFDLWPWKLLSNAHWHDEFHFSFIEIPPLSKTYIAVLTDNGRPDGRPTHIMPLVACCWQQRQKTDEQKKIWKQSSIVSEIIAARVDDGKDLCTARVLHCTALNSEW